MLIPVLAGVENHQDKDPRSKRVRLEQEGPGVGEQEPGAVLTGQW